MYLILLSFFSSFVASAGQNFPCKAVTPAKAVPENVTELHPAHISVVMAVGDSITAAFAAKPLVENRGKLGEPLLPLEYRGLSFSGGMGSQSSITLPFLLSRYNSSLTGFSKHDTAPQLPSTGYLDEDANGLNVALSNAHSWQVHTEIEELQKQTSKINGIDEKWKLLTLLIGANDLCDGNTADYGGGFAACDGSTRNRSALADRYEDKLREALTKIRDTQKRIVVQLVSMFSLKSVFQVRHSSFWCNTVGILRSAISECNCLDKSISGSGSPSEEQLNNLDATVADFNVRLHKLAVEFNLQRPDFAVINEDGLAGQGLPDRSYLSNLDCFHPSAKAHGAVAVALWNGLFDRNRSPKPLDAGITPFCPTPETTIFVGNEPVPSSTSQLIV